jgi:hypothetical protein
VAAVRRRGGGRSLGGRSLWSVAEAGGKYGRRQAEEAGVTPHPWDPSHATSPRDPSHATPMGRLSRHTQGTPLTPHGTPKGPLSRHTQGTPLTPHPWDPSHATPKEPLSRHTQGTPLMPHPRNPIHATGDTHPWDPSHATPKGPLSRHTHGGRCPCVNHALHPLTDNPRAAPFY